MPDLEGFHYRATSSTDTRPPFLLLHGSNRDETELPPRAETAAPGWPYLSLRGPIPWESGYAFFRRNPDRTLDHADLALQTERLTPSSKPQSRAACSPVRRSSWVSPTAPSSPPP
ncbi:hypothetical protein [Rhizobium sp.]|uniref:hypothetical protein n=1 Tax=Rhizobium sp. TaxID=391 RepID=UPI0028AD4D11